MRRFYFPNSQLGFVAPKKQTASAPPVHGSAFAPQPRVAPPPTIVHATGGPTLRPIILPTTTGPIKIPLTDVRQNIPPEQFRYTDDQIKEMLQRGKSETVERSGESDSGLPPAEDLEQQADDRDATTAFITETENGLTVPTAKPDEPNLAPLALLALGWLLLGG